MQTKTCTKCNVEKATTEFYKDKDGKYGVHSHCKECRRKHFHNPEALERKRKRRNELMQRPGMKERERLRSRIREQSPERLEYQRERRKESQKLGLVRECKSTEIAKKHATRKGRWSDAEIKFLMTSDLPLVDIALELGRTYSSVAQRRFKLLQSR